MSTSRVASLGEYLREQRNAAELSLRQLAEQAGVSNPYLSQVERGLRKPSAEVLNKIAAALQIYADQFCGLALQPCNWFHPDSSAAVIANCTAASAF